MEKESRLTLTILVAIVLLTCIYILAAYLENLVTTLSYISFIEGSMEIWSYLAI